MSKKKKKNTKINWIQVEKEEGTGNRRKRITCYKGNKSITLDLAKLTPEQKELTYQIIGDWEKVKSRLRKRKENVITYHLQRTAERSRLRRLLSGIEKEGGKPKEIAKTNVFYILNKYE
jgi:hypothetical protein